MGQAPKNFWSGRTPQHNVPGTGEMESQTTTLEKPKTASTSSQQTMGAIPRSLPVILSAPQSTVRIIGPKAYLLEPVTISHNSSVSGLSGVIVYFQENVANYGN